MVGFALLSTARTHADPACTDYYFGIGMPVDFGKARACFEKDSNWTFLALMRLNGEGAPADLKEARRLWTKAAHEDTANGGSLSIVSAYIDSALTAGEANPGKPIPRMNYCDIAANGNTLDIDFCMGVDEELQKFRGLGEIDSVERTLLPAAGAALNKVSSAFETFDELEGARMSQEYIEGTIRSVAGTSYEMFIRDRFMALFREVVEKRGLKPTDDNAYKRADAELNRFYGKDLRRNSYTDELKDSAQKDEWERFRGEARDYRKAAKDAELQWMRYRDAWAELAPLLYADKTKIPDPALSIKAALSRGRVEELCHDPEAPDDHGNVCAPDGK